MDMIDGLVKGYFLLGQNPAVGSVHGRLQRLAMANLDWLVVRDLAMIESATFWKDSPEVESGEIVPERVPDRGVLLPGRLARGEGRHVHPDTQRLLQWREKAVEPSGDQRSELWFFYHLGRLIKDRLADSDRPAGPAGPGPQLGLRDQRRTGLTSRAVGRVGAQGDQRLRPGRAARRLHRPQGRRLDLLRLLDLLAGCTRTGVNQAGPAQAPRPSRTATVPGVGLGLADKPAGALQPRLRRPGRQAVVRAQEVRLVGRGAGPSGSAGTCRTSRRPSRRRTGRRRARSGRRRCAATTRSSCRPTARAGCSCRTGCRTGRCRRHYEPHESPFRNALYGQQGNPTRKVYGRDDNPSNPSPPEAHSEVFPYVLTTSRLTEHHTAGGMSRQPAVPVRAAAGDVRRGVAAAGRAGRAGATSAGRRWSPAAARSRPGCWSPSGCARCGCRTGSCTRSGCPTTGATPAWSPATRPTTCSASCSTRTC